MPFVTSQHRQCPDVNIPGDRCFLQYRQFMDMWNEQPRWTTIDTFSKRIWPDDNQRAAALALLVFMYKHGFNYEDIKEAENGPII